MRGFVRVALVLAGLAAVLAAAMLSESGRRWSVEGAGRPLTGPLRLEVGSPDAYAQLLVGLRVHHYRPRSKSQTRFRDVFFDTPGWDLHARGYSYRFRTRLEGSGGSKYSVRIEQERRFVPAGATKLELAAELPDEIGAAIEAGAWQRAISEAGVAPAERLRGVLRDLDLPPAEVGARLVADVRRERLDVSDKGRDWFQLDRESWSFRRFDQADGPPVVAFEDVVIDTQLGGQDPELLRRVQTMDQFVRGIPGLGPAERAPHERAIEAVARDAQVTDPEVAAAASDARAPTCAIDMGSNSFKRIVGSFDAGRYEQRSIDKKTLGVGEDLSRNGRISDGKLAEIEATLSAFKAACAEQGATRVVAIGTAAFREAPNGARVVEIAAKLGIPMEIATEKRESELAYLVGSLGGDGYAVIDNGSRSIELVSKDAGQAPRFSVFNLGYRVAYQEFFAAAVDAGSAIRAFRDRVKQEAVGAPFMRGKRKLVGVEFEEMAEVLFPPDETEGRVFTREELKRRLDEIATSRAAEFEALKQKEDIDRALPRLVVAVTLAEEFGYAAFELTARELGTGLIIEAGMQRS